MKKDVSFFEVYGKVNYTFNDNWPLGVQRLLFAELPELAAPGATTLRSPASTPRRARSSAPAASACTSPAIRPPVARHLGLFYGTGRRPFPNGINYADYNTWNIGIGFTYKVFTLDLRYSDTNLSKGNCNAFTSDFNRDSGTHQRHPDQSDGRRFELVRRGWHRQALG